MNKIFRNTLIGLCAGSSFSVQAQKKQDQPNIVILLADDLGYGDLGVTGSPDCKTPNIDALAHDGVRFTNYYTSGPVCSPTRSALMTGRYQARFKNMEGAFHLGVDFIGLPENEETIGKALQRANYKTGLVGKWHLGSLPHMQPQNQGFDEFFGFLGGNIDYFRHCNKDGTPDLYQNGKAITSGKYMTDLITKKSIDFIRKNKKKPFCLYVAYNAPHWPYQGPDDEEMDLTGIKWMRSTRDHLVSMIERLDYSVGEIRKALKKMGLEKNTLIVFSSDNGGDRLARNIPFSGRKGHLRDGGIHSPLYMVWPAELEKGKTIDQPCITMDLSRTILELAHAKINAPLDGVNLLKKEELEKERSLCWRNNWHNEHAVRKGKWKLLHEKGKDYLFDLDNDAVEAHDLKSDYPEVFQDLQKEFQRWEEEMPYKQTLFGKDLLQLKNN